MGINENMGDKNEMECSMKEKAAAEKMVHLKHEVRFVLYLDNIRRNRKKNVSLKRFFMLDVKLVLKPSKRNSVNLIFCSLFLYISVT